ncbi:MAG: hypothetical protein KDA54_06845 [Phycisphaerales bacterium]|nr:hypothetical protein [Phycisphaerales bacterium]
MTSQRFVVVTVVLAVAVLIVQFAGAEDGKFHEVQYKTVFVPSVPVQAKQLGESEVEIDGPRFAKDLEVAVRKLASEGFEVESTVPMISGMYRYASEQPVKRSQSASAFGYGYGYSVTSGVTIIARKG